MTKKKFDAYEHVTERIVEYFESSEKPDWKAPWQGLDLPRNADTGRLYNGINVLLLWIRMQIEGWENSLFLTFNQVKKVGEKFPDDTCHVSKGSKSEKICYWKRIESEDKETGEKKFFPMLKLYNVYNVEQIECSEQVREYLERRASSFTFEDEREAIDACEEFLANLGSMVYHKGTKAYYFPKADTIHMPKLERFVSSEAYYSTRFHEEGHRTGHESRCNRDLKNRFGDDAYAFEEMVAEIASAFLCARFNFASELQHPEYVTHWCRRAREDKHAIFKAASLAKKAVEWMDDQQEGNEIAA